MSRLATFLACDAVANAGLGKVAFVGIYGAEILVPHLPFILQQLFFVVRFRTPIEDPPKQLRVRLERAGQEPFIIDQTAALPPPGPRPDNATFFEAQAVVRLAPFIVDQESLVRVFVDDEIGENYAGGLRLKLGTHPEATAPQIAGSATLAIGHYNRLSETPRSTRQEVATQLLESLSQFISYSGSPTHLQFPDSDMRLVLDNQRVHVFFPHPREDDEIDIALEPAPTFEDWKIERVDRVGFVVRFEPNAPADSLFNYAVVDRSKEFIKARAPTSSKSKKAPSKKRPKKSPK